MNEAYEITWQVYAIMLLCVCAGLAGAWIVQKLGDKKDEG